jgi:hypothetical protein
MNVDFVREAGDEDDKPQVPPYRTGWETVVFELEDLPEDAIAEESRST